MGKTGNKIALLEVSIEVVEGLIADLKHMVHICQQRIGALADRINKLEELAEMEPSL